MTVHRAQWRCKRACRAGPTLECAQLAALLLAAINLRLARCRVQIIAPLALLGAPTVPRPIIALQAA